MERTSSKAKSVLIGLGFILVMALSVGDEKERSAQHPFVPVETEAADSSFEAYEEYRRPDSEPERESSCHPSYSGCLNRYAGDYDCAGGSGNGPYYTGAVRVTGPDVFGLDRDGNGWGCE